MNHATTVLNQLHHLLPLYQFERFVGQHKADRYSKHFTCKNQLTILLYAQATGKDSLREIETSMRIQSNKWYHLGLTNVARSTLATANKKRPYCIYESLFYELAKRCQNLVSGTASFSFQNPLYAIDSTTIELCLSLFPWAKFRKVKGAIKLHTLFNVRSQIPELINMTDGKRSDIKEAWTMNFDHFSKGSIFVIDRGYTDYSFLYNLHKQEHYFVIRLKKNAHILFLKNYATNALEPNILKDEIITFILPHAHEKYPEDVRLVTYYDSEYKITYEFITNNFELSPIQIAHIYKLRWQIELFFKWIKQHLKIKTFLGTSKNAVMTQIWVAMIYYLLLMWIKQQTRFHGSLLELTRIIEVTIMEMVSLINLLNLTSLTAKKIIADHDPPQLSLF